MRTALNPDDNISNWFENMMFVFAIASRGFEQLQFMHKTNFSHCQW